MGREKLKNVGALADKLKIKIEECSNEWKAALSTARELKGECRGLFIEIRKGHFLERICKCSNGKLATLDTAIVTVLRKSLFINDRKREGILDNWLKSRFSNKMANSLEENYNKNDSWQYWMFLTMTFGFDSQNTLFWGHICSFCVSYLLSLENTINSL